MSESEEMDDLEVDKLAENLEDQSWPETTVAPLVQDANFTGSASSSTGESMMSELEKVAEQEKRRILKGKQVADLLTTSESEEGNLEDQQRSQTEFPQLVQDANSTDRSPTLSASSSTGESTPSCQWLLQRHPRLWLKMKSDWNELYDWFLCTPNIIDALISLNPGLSLSGYAAFTTGASPDAYLIFNSGGIWSRPQVLRTVEDLRFVMKYILVRWSCRDLKPGYSYSIQATKEEFSVPVGDNLVMKTWEGVQKLMSIANTVNKFEQRDEFSVLFDSFSISADNEPPFENKVSWFRRIWPCLRKLRYRFLLTLSDMIRGNITPPTQSSGVQLPDMGADVTNPTSDPQP